MNKLPGRPPGSFARSLFISFLLFACPILSPAQTADPSDVLRLITQAGSLSRQGNFDGAIELYQQAIKLSPKDSMIRLYLGLALENKGAFSEAAQVYDDAISLQQNTNPKGNL